MSGVVHVQKSFNGGEVSRRLRARIDQAFYDVALEDMVGFAPLVEGAAEAMPGTIHVETLPGPARLVPFEYSTTQGHVLAFGSGIVSIFTNDAYLTEIESPYSYTRARELRTHESYDVLYCFHGDLPPREFYRDSAETFGFDVLELTGGPFEARNTQEDIRVTANGLTGQIRLRVTADEPADAEIFVETDVGSLFRMEAEDFGDITSWEPYITVTKGQMLTWGERVYRVVGGNPDVDGIIRTGSVQPVHTEGVEWDGIGTGTDINDEPAAGVQLEYVHDRFGIVLITSLSSPSEANAKVLRHLPLSAVGEAEEDGEGGYTGNYTGRYSWDYGYYDPEWDVYSPPAEAVPYKYGTWRWAFGSFSDTRGWPTCGVIWDGRLCLAKGSTIYGSVKYDLTNHSEYNELGEVSADMAFIETLDDPNPIKHLVAEDRLLALTASGIHALGPNSAASGVGPGKVKAERQNDAGCSDAPPISINSRTLYIDRSQSRIYESDLDPGRRVEQELDLTRYARNMGNSGFVELASQQHPMNHLWAVRGDGSLCCAVYQPEEQALGFAPRLLAQGMVARRICRITDTEGKYDQIWLCAFNKGQWHVLRMAPWRLDGESDDTACVLDMALEHDGLARGEFALPHLPETDIACVANGVLYRMTTDAEGKFTLPDGDMAERAVAGLEFDAYMTSLPIEAGGDNGPAMGRKAKWHRAFVRVEAARGLAFGVPGEDLKPLEQLDGSSVPEDAYAAETGYRFAEALGSHTREPRLMVRRISPFQSTVLAWGGELSVEGL